MRYDKLLKAIDTLREKYEADLRNILASAAAADAATSTQMLAALLPGARKGRGPYKKKTALRWQQTPRGKAKLRRLAKARWAKKRGL